MTVFPYSRAITRAGEEQEHATSANPSRGPAGSPTWNRIKAHLQAAGLMDERGITRRVRATTCRTCNAPTLSGLSSDAAAHTADVDPEPLSALGEALALLAGRQTYALRHLGGRWQLTPRSSFAITGSPAGTIRYDVHAAHACGAPPLPTAPTAHQAIAAVDLTTPGLPAPF